MADGYDAAFTHTLIGTLMRRAVWRRLDARFAPGGRVLELSCGTGEDAVHLAERGVRVLATDVSERMVAAAAAKAERAGVAGRVETRRLAMEELRPLAEGLSIFDGAFSNFGGLNCASDLSAVAEGLAACVRPGGYALLCVMGPVAPWEWAWMLGHGRPRAAFRRLRRGGAEWRGLTVRYPTIGAVRSAFAPEFRLARAAAVGALVPPPYAERWAWRHPRLLGWLDRCERRVETRWPLPWLADHYVVELERV